MTVEYQKKLDEHVNSFYLILENFKESYAAFKTHPIPENKNKYEQYKTNLEKLYNDLFLLENDILINSDIVADSSITNNMNLMEKKQKFKTLNAERNKLQHSTDVYAAKPRYLDYLYNLRVAQTQLAMFVVGLGGFGYIFFKHLND